MDSLKTFCKAPSYTPHDAQSCQDGLRMNMVGGEKDKRRSAFSPRAPVLPSLHPEKYVIEGYKGRICCFSKVAKPT